MRTLTIGVIVCGVLTWLLIALWPSLSHVESVAIGPGPSVVIDLAEIDTTQVSLAGHFIGEGKWFFREKTGPTILFYDMPPRQVPNLTDQVVETAEPGKEGLGTAVILEMGRVTAIISKETLTIPFFPTLATVLTVGSLVVAALVIAYWLRRRHGHRARVQCKADYALDGKS